MAELGQAVEIHFYFSKNVELVYTWVVKVNAQIELIPLHPPHPSPWAQSPHLELSALGVGRGDLEAARMGWSLT